MYIFLSPIVYREFLLFNPLRRVFIKSKNNYSICRISFAVSKSHISSLAGVRTLRLGVALRHKLCAPT